jgi:RNA polymerase sigma factor (sigma-70 family)
MENPPLELLKRCKGNDRKAHFDLYKWCFDDLIRISRRYYVNDDELKASVNMSFLKIIQSMETIIHKYDDLVFFHWMKRITINNIIDEFRKNKNYRNSIEILETQDIININTEENYDTSFSQDDMAEIQLAIDTLPHMNKAVFVLYAIDGYKHEEIGKLLNISANTSKVHFFKARHKLQLLLAKHKSLSS